MTAWPAQTKNAKTAVSAQPLPANLVQEATEYLRMLVHVLLQDILMHFNSTTYRRTRAQPVPTLNAWRVLSLIRVSVTPVMELIVLGLHAPVLHWVILIILQPEYHLATIAWPV